MGQWLTNTNSRTRRNARNKAVRVARETALKNAHATAEDLLVDPVSETGPSCVAVTGPKA